MKPIKEIQEHFEELKYTSVLNQKIWITEVLNGYQEAIDTCQKLEKTLKYYKKCQGRVEMKEVFKK